MPASTKTPTYPWPQVDKATQILIEVATASLAVTRNISGSRVDFPAQCHLLATLAAQVKISLDSVVFAARHDGYSWEEIARFIGTDKKRAVETYGDLCASLPSRTQRKPT